MVLDKLGSALKSGVKKISNAILIDKKLVDAIVKDIQTMKDAVKKNEKIPEDIQYPSREAFIKEEMDKLDKNQ